MTLQQQLADRVGGLSDEGVKLVEQLLDGMNPRFFVVKLDRDGESQKEKNIQLLSEMMAYQTKEDDDFVSDMVIDNAVKLVFHLTHQPELFKTFENSINMQFELSDRSYMELEVFEKRITCMIVPQREYVRALFPEVSLDDIGGINKVVEDFYSDKWSGS